MPSTLLTLQSVADVSSGLNTHKALHQQFYTFSVKLSLLFLQEFPSRYFFQITHEAFEVN